MTSQDKLFNMVSEELIKRAKTELKLKGHEFNQSHIDLLIMVSDNLIAVKFWELVDDLQLGDIISDQLLKQEDLLKKFEQSVGASAEDFFIETFMNFINDILE